MDSYNNYTSSAGKTMLQVNVSTTFFPAAILPGAHGRIPDVVLCSSDLSFFYVHRSVLLSRSSNSFGCNIAPSLSSFPPSVYPSDLSISPSSTRIFDSPFMTSPVSSPTPYGWPPPDDAYDGGAYFGHAGCTSPGSTRLNSAEWDSNNLFAAPPVPAPVRDALSIQVGETSVVLNIVLHLIYGMDCERYGPDLETIAQALVSLGKYGVTVPLDSSAKIWELLLRHAPSHPIRVYAIAASHDNHPIATVASRYTLLVSLDAVSEADALTMGPVYLRLLFRLHLGRHEALHRVIKAPPREHLPSALCPINSQGRLADIKTAWAVGVGAVMHLPGSHNTSTGSLLDAFGGVLYHESSSCKVCEDHARVRIAEVIRDWLAVKSTI